MKKYIIFVFLVFAIQSVCNAQVNKSAELRHELANATHDTTRLRIMLKLSTWYRIRRPDSTIYYGNKAIILARKLNNSNGEVFVMHHIALAHMNLGNDAKAFQLTLKALKIAEERMLTKENAQLLMDLGELYSKKGNYSKALSLNREAKNLFDSVNIIRFSILTQSKMGRIFSKMNQADSALYYGIMANDNAEIHKGWPRKITLYNLAEIYNHKGDTNLALEYFIQSLQLLAKNSHTFSQCNYAIALIYLQLSRSDSSIYYAKKSLESALKSGIYSDISNANLLLSDIYENTDPQKAIEYNKMAITYMDSLYNLVITTASETTLEFDEQEQQYEIEKATATYKNKVQRLWIFSIAGALISALLVSLILYRNNKNKQKANTLLKEQKEEIQSTLDKLESTQSQLIQSEKMASLGELTAGIAHEIQNPLNFVNNFAEVSGELVDELKEERTKKKGERDKELEEEILNDITQNLEKINHHGQRASGIVKGMLEHSRTSTGKKELTDINKLADEYLRLAYHGLRAKDKSFNADFKLDLDNTLPKINVISQDIGRVLLNLINNAFYAVSKKTNGGSEDYKPEVIVSTELSPSFGGGKGEEIRISIKDNGPGIPAEIKDKIFQPFFTTKPTGQGTGLGLSLAYDIITKGHNGHLEVETEEGLGTRFVVRLPIV